MKRSFDIKRIEKSQVCTHDSFSSILSSHSFISDHRIGPTSIPHQIFQVIFILNKFPHHFYCPCISTLVSTAYHPCLHFFFSLSTTANDSDFLLIFLVTLFLSLGSYSLLYFPLIVVSTYLPLKIVFLFLFPNFFF